MAINIKSPTIIAVAAAHGIPVRNPFESHHKNMYHWAIDEKETNPMVKTAFAMMSAPQTLPTLKAPPVGHAIARNTFLRRYRLPGLLNHIYVLVREQAYNHYKGNRTGMYFLASKIRYVFRRWRVGQKFLREKSLKLADISGKKFVFYPLHVEPEVALQGKSPEFLVQMTAIVSLARHLPADMVLVVKEHLSGAGRRPPAFYRQIRDLKNVIWLDVRELGLDIVQSATAVATITGSAGFEAAVLGIPVLSFGRHNLFNFLPHVFEIREEEQLRGFLETILNPEFPREKAAADGAKFLESVKDISFDLEDYNYHLTAEGFTAKSVEQATTMLEKSLITEPRPSATHSQSRDAAASRPGS
jgi:hypothetical protein